MRLSARMIGLPPTDQYDVSDAIPFSAAPPLDLDDAIHQALAARADSWLLASFSAAALAAGYSVSYLRRRSWPTASPSQIPVAGPGDFLDLLFLESARWC